MPKLPKHDYSVSELMEEKLYVITYKYHSVDGWFADTWSIRETNMGYALDRVSEWFDSKIDSGEWDTYKVVMIMEIEGSEE